MITSALTRAIKHKKPSVIRGEGRPRYVVLDWKTYHAWQEMREDIEDHIRFEIAERESRGRKRYTLREIKKKYHLS